MNNTYTDRFAALATSDRRLLALMSAASLVILVLGIMGGLMTALARGGFIDILNTTGYRWLTLHGVSIFFYWLFIAQAALLLGFAAIERGRGLVLKALAWLGFASILVGFGLSMVGIQQGMPLLYDGAPELARYAPRDLLVFNLGYLLLGLGLMILPLSAIATLIEPRRAGRQERLSAVGFALFTWAGFLIVSGFAAIYTFLPGTLWALGWADFPANHGTNWHIVFHNMHYLPLMATVLLWYVLIHALTGVKSVFGERFSKIVFALYLVFVPPTSLYHMFLEPDLPGVVRVVGSLLSLFVSVPTLTAFLIIVASLEVYARSQGGRGLFGWIRLLPWRHPAMSAIAVAVLSMGLGITFAFVLIQEQLAPLLSDTFFVPGYFHFFTVGTVSLTLLAALQVMLPGLGGRAAWRPELMRLLPWLAFIGLLLFGGAGVAAGYLGVPRRVMDMAYQGQAPEMWQILMATVAIGGSIMALALILFAAGVAVSLLPRRQPLSEQVGLTVDWSRHVVSPGLRAMTGPLSILVIVLAMYGFTIIGFEMMQALPATASGGGGH
ncbi:cbb3-type cytochrome c oxidase subunit I [Nitrincola alkalilacustris]|uniref:cbb3-type cytochrome c oxidase subunit I n=1 Tax=Nitrincola alkalilacustris TaxID=1571224 RepID=UPI00124EAB8B|nr:cbb3-type cytochrome c oxidase subunit I [Nitrincola alkalilacustris]